MVYIHFINAIVGAVCWVMALVACAIALFFYRDPQWVTAFAVIAIVADMHVESSLFNFRRMTGDAP